LASFGPSASDYGIRALAKERKEGLTWFWIGGQDTYEQILNK
jgi:hypothetical protein